jgi:hypothetical protein
LWERPDAAAAVRAARTDANSGATFDFHHHHDHGAAS